MARQIAAAQRSRKSMAAAALLLAVAMTVAAGAARAQLSEPCRFNDVGEVWMPGTIGLPGNVAQDVLSLNTASPFAVPADELARYTNLRLLVLDQLAHLRVVPQLPRLRTVALWLGAFPSTFLSYLGGVSVEQIAFSGLINDAPATVAVVPPLVATHVSWLQINHSGRGVTWNLAELDRLPFLETLQLKSATLASLAPLAGATRLRHLVLDDIEVAAGERLLDLSALAALDCFSAKNSGKPKAWILSLPASGSLRLLSLQQAAPVSIDGLDRQADLVSLDLAYSRIDDFSFLPRLTRLERLWLQGTALPDLELVPGEALQRLGIDARLLRSADALDRFPHLRQLYLRGPIDVDLVLALTEKESLQRIGGQLGDPEDLDALRGLADFRLTWFTRSGDFQLFRF